MTPEAHLNLLTVLSQPFFFTHKETWVELEEVYQRFQRAKTEPYYNNPQIFWDDVRKLN